MTNEPRLHIHFVCLVVLGVALATNACANETLKGSSVAAVGVSAAVRKNVAPPKKKTAPSISATKAGVLVQAPTGESYVAPGIANSRRKNLPLLRSSIVTCLGADENAFEVKQEMMADEKTKPEPDAVGRVPFLAPGYNRDAANMRVVSVLDIERAYLDDPGSLKRASVQGSDLDDLAYMVATIAVANTVAWNVDLERLDCGTPAKAKAFLAQCLPGEEDAVLSLASRELGSATACGAKPPFERRKALATFLASYIFLRVR